MAGFINSVSLQHSLDHRRWPLYRLRGLCPLRHNHLQGSHLVLRALALLLPGLSGPGAALSLSARALSPLARSWPGCREEGEDTGLVS